jgi:hypothetical protein
MASPNNLTPLSRVSAHDVYPTSTSQAFPVIRRYSWPRSWPLVEETRDQIRAA